MYMVPPFLAYYGVITSNITLLQQAYTQIKLYRNYLRDPKGLWKHVLLGSSGIDEGHWSTGKKREVYFQTHKFSYAHQGNGWAAAGMLRVLATIKNSQYANSMKSEQEDLANWVIEIQNEMYSHLVSLNLQPWIL